VPLGADVNLRTVVLLVGGYSLAWAVGFVVIVAPAGAGARGGGTGRPSLNPVLDHNSAKVVVVVLLSRVLFTAGRTWPRLVSGCWAGTRLPPSGSSRRSGPSAEPVEPSVEP